MKKQPKFTVVKVTSEYESHHNGDISIDEDYLMYKDGREFCFQSGEIWYRDTAFMDSKILMREELTDAAGKRYILRELKKELKHQDTKLKDKIKRHKKSIKKLTDFEKLIK